MTQSSSNQDASQEKHARRVLVIDDHPTARQSVVDVLTCTGYEVHSCASAIEGLNYLTSNAADVIVTDLQMPGMNGLELVAEVTRRQLPTQMLMVTAHASVTTAVEAMRLGAFDYLEKPFNATQLEESVSRAFARGELLNPAKETTPTHANPTAPLLIGSSPAMQQLRAQIERVAATDETVLIGGESGVGKELIAKTIHALSNRRDASLVSLNCPVLSEQLTESELFGHCRGAFTGADADRIGRFEQAGDGTILLDEITEISPQLQAKLLRVLQERTFERVGSSETKPLSARVLAATNRDLQEEVAQGRFREDLYYRLAVVPIAAPPLRERDGDVLELADHFLADASQRLSKPARLSEEARSLFLAYQWPGNVRELQNLVTRACVLCDADEIPATLVQPWMASEGLTENAAIACTVQAAETEVGMSLAEMERKMIEATLAHHQGHRQRTADALGIGVRTLSGKLRQYGYAPGEKSFARAS